MNRGTRDRKIYENSYTWEEKPISELVPGDILVRRWEVGQPYGVVNGPSKTGRDVVPDSPESADFVFVPMRPLEAAWDNSTSRLTYVENGQEGIYAVFAPHNKTAPVAIVRKGSE